MPALLRAGRRQRPGRAVDQRGARRRRVDRQRPEDLDLLRPLRPLRDPDRPHRPRRAQAQGHHLLRLPDGCRGDRGPSHHRDDRRTHLQRGVLHRCADPGRERGGRGQRRLAPGQGHPRQRTGVAQQWGSAVGQWARRRRTCSTWCAPARRRERPAHAPATGAALHRVRDPATHPAAHRHRCHQGRGTRTRGLGAQDPGRRARQADHGGGQGPVRARPA